MQKQIVMEEMKKDKSDDVIKKLQDDIVRRREDLKNAERQTTINGPFIDINQYVRQGFSETSKKTSDRDDSAEVKEKLLAADVAKRMKKRK